MSDPYAYSTREPNYCRGPTIHARPGGKLLNLAHAAQTRNDCRHGAYTHYIGPYTTVFRPCAVSNQRLERADGSNLGRSGDAART